MRKDVSFLQTMANKCVKPFAAMPTFITAWLLSCVLMFVSPTLRSQTLQRATGGAGLYKNNIWWLNFTGLTLNAGDSITQTYNVEGGLYTLVVTIDSISFSGFLTGGQPLSNQRLVPYATASDGGLGAYYNNGPVNTLRYGLISKINGAGGTNLAICNFRVRAYAYLNADGSPLDMGMVTANAEGEGAPEYTQSITNGSPWQLFEAHFATPAAQHSLKRFNNGLGIIKKMGGSNQHLTYTKKVSSAAANPLKVNMELGGSGQTAIAFGFFLTGSDRGDAPDSYGTGVNKFFTTINGGDPGVDTTYYLSTLGPWGAPSSSLIHPVGAPVLPSFPRLGNIAGDVDDFTTVAGTMADHDNTTGLNDEDALNPLAPIAAGTSISNYSITVPVTIDPARTTYLNAWMDLDRNGVFDVSEKQAIVVNASGNVAINWPVPTDFTATSGTRYIRLRVHNDARGIALNAADSVFGPGETEDFAFEIIQLLPTTLKDFKVYSQNEDAKLFWITTSEQNNKGFEIQRSADGLTWHTISFVNSQSEKNTANVKFDYAFTDSNPLNGNSYYRLKQVDRDGKYEYSPIRKLSVNENKTTTIQIYPNPVQNELRVKNLTGTDNAIRLISTLGQVVYTSQPVNTPAISINLSSVAKGVYFVVVNNKSGATVTTYKVIKE